MTAFTLGGFYRGKRIVPRVFSTTTESGAASFVVPPDVTEIIGKCWGAGGGAGYGTSFSGGNGGPGGYAQSILTVTPGETLTIYVPTGGICPALTLAGPGGTGGSFAGIFRSTTPLLVAGGGGGGGAGRNAGGPGGVGGSGGGSTGTAGTAASSGGAGGGGGTQSAGGSAGLSGSAGAQWIGGNFNGSTSNGGRNGASALGTNAGNGGGITEFSDRAAGGGGGAGYYGGGAGGRGQSDPNTGGGGGGGGSNYLTGSNQISLQGSGVNAPNQDRDYIARRGQGGTGIVGRGSNGNAGLVVILF